MVPSAPQSNFTWIYKKKSLSTITFSECIFGSSSRFHRVLLENLHRLKKNHSIKASSYQKLGPWEDRSAIFFGGPIFFRKFSKKMKKSKNRKFFENSLIFRFFGKFSMFRFSKNFRFFFGPQKKSPTDLLKDLTFGRMKLLSNGFFLIAREFQGQHAGTGQNVRKCPQKKKVYIL